LLEIYSSLDMDRLQKTISADWRILLNNDLSRVEKDTGNEDDVLFTEDVGEQFIPSAPITLTITEQDEEIDIDDI